MILRTHAHRILIVSMLLATASALAATADESKPTDWTRSEYGDFAVVSNAPRSSVATIATQISDLSHILDGMFPGTAGATADELVVIAFADAGDYHPFSPTGSARTVPGFYDRIEGHGVIAINLDAKMPTREIMLHEYIHHWVRQRLPYLPMWLNEGLAEFFSTAEWGVGEITVGKRVEHRVRTLVNSNRLIPGSELVLIDHRHGLDAPQLDMGLFYAQSWLTVHMMYAVGNATRFGSYVQALRAGLSPQEAFQLVFDLDDASFDAALRKHFSEKLGSYFRLTLDGSPLLERRSAEQLSEAELYCYQALIFEIAGAEALPKAIGYYHRAAELAPDLSLPWIGRARVSASRGEFAEAIQQLDRALQIDPDDRLVRVLLGQLLIEEPSRRPEGVSLLEAVLQEDPDNVLAKGYLAWARFFEDPMQALVHLRPIVEMVPSDERLVGRFIVVRDAVGDIQGAREQWEAYRRWSSEGMSNWVERNLTPVAAAP